MWVKHSWSAVAFALALGPSFQAPPLEGQYFIQTVGGAWEVRQKGVKDRPLVPYDIITTAAQVRCMKAPCTLEYSTNGAAKPLFPKPPTLERWVSPPPPTDPPAAPTAIEMQQLLGRAGVRGGAEKDVQSCGGDLPLVAPRCREAVDPEAFKLQWIPRAEDAGKTYSLVLGPIDQSDRRRFNGIAADAGELQLKTIQDYLNAVQLPDRSVDVTLRLVRTENLDAVRIVRVMSSSDAREHRLALRQFDALPDLTRDLSYLGQYLKAGMWSRAADIARTMLKRSPDSLEIQKYALVGYCGTDYAADIARLRATLRDAGVTGICEPGGVVK
jgi:hypothetical protein